MSLNVNWASGGEYSGRIPIPYYWNRQFRGKETEEKEEKEEEEEEEEEETKKKKKHSSRRNKLPADRSTNKWNTNIEWHGIWNKNKRRQQKLREREREREGEREAIRLQSEGQTPNGSCIQSTNISARNAQIDEWITHTSTLTHSHTYTHRGADTESLWAAIIMMITAITTV